MSPPNQIDSHITQMELTIDQALQQGVAAHKEGKLQDAERLYRAVLQAQPKHPDANHNLGVLAVAVGKPLGALPLFKLALEANPKIEQFWLSYIDALIRLERFDSARRVLADAQQAGVTTAKLQIFQEQLEFQLSSGSDVTQQEFANELQRHQDELSPAIELREVGKYKEAQKWLSNVIENDPKNAGALSLLSQVLSLDKKEAEAERVLTEAVSINSELPSVYLNQARLLLKQSKTAEALEKAKLGYRQSSEDSESSLVLAACLAANQRDSEALPIIEKILKAQPNYAEAYANRALIRLRAKDTIGGIEDAKMAVSLKPHLTQMWQLLSSLYYQANNLSAAIEAMRGARKNEPENVAFMTKLGEFLRQDNKASEAITILEQATGLAPKDANVWTNLGVAFQQEKRAAEAKIAYEKALFLNPESAVIASNLGVMAKEAEEWDSALQYFGKALEIEFNFAEAHSNLGVTLQELGRLEEAEASLRQAIVLKPDYVEAHRNLGNTLKQLGKLDEAEASCRKAIALRPDFAEAHNNLGNTLTELGKADDAEASYRRAIALKPDYAEAHNNLGNTLKELGRLDEAEASCRKAIALKPDYAEAHNNLGNTLTELSKVDDAEASYRRAIALRPDYDETYYNLFELFDKTNAIDELLMFLDEARSKINSKKADFLYYETLVLFRKEHYVEADALIFGKAEGDVHKVRKAAYFKLKGDLRHRSQDYDAAFLCYVNSNLAVKTSAEYRRLEAAADRYFDLQGNVARELAQLSIGSPYTHRISFEERQPTFLVGFPRSGTTLLDTILRTHSKINVVEEQDMVTKMRLALGGLESVSAIEAIDENDSDVASDAYHEELARHTNWPDESLLIDKLPLNLLQAPLINRIFPEAKFILAVRHPLDCILSCWMQTFKLNSAMANMVDLDRIVDFYCVAMDTYQLSQRRYGLNTHIVRYEDLVKNFEGEVTNILSFLDLEWEAELRDYRATALARGKINTPSRSQVIKPIYKTASYRWKHYEKHLDKYKSKLAPWFEEFGY